MSISVNKDLCIGCGACAALCPSGFAMNADGKAEAVSQEGLDCAQNASSSCPVQAITAE
ncbi:MAG: Ferredoxin [Candidatus Falkowbacteria bacterium GW2011_GWC2_38_22]|nr:MAG: Ferredoxin [Candidatus Falkowbacteria bacterium GW2011_GWC2_38_22]HAM88137.1 ferredoxin [Candidatus Falkowbacteria bacterium]HAY11741.1 ferredoxin [Candidatus Falkowbacteria bacterium]HBI97675.1 ferredoxin [Candidatus Falkowbacteria bacterium]HBT27406.1 ferredoxin [Candidatus Falkowbacteria bacterium]